MTVSLGENSEKLGVLWSEQCEGEALRESTLPCPRPEREGIGNYHVFTVPKPVDSRQGQRFLSVTKGIMSTEEGGYSKPDLTGGGRA